jgi:hypothetical protein
LITSDLNREKWKRKIHDSQEFILKNACKKKEQGVGVRSCYINHSSILLLSVCPIGPRSVIIKQITEKARTSAWLKN